MANETVLFKRGDSATITSTPVTDGQILFDTSGNGKMYLDNGTDRLEMGGAITVDASLSKTSTNAIQNKAVTGNILNSLAEVSAATQQNTIAGALALKEVNSSLVADNAQTFQFAYDSASGKYGYKAKVEGADTFFPFSSGSAEVVMFFQCIVELGNIVTSYSTDTNYTVNEKGTYSIVTMTNSYLNSGYNVYHNSDIVASVTYSQNGGKTAISYNQVNIECEVGDTISISDISAPSNSHNMLIHALVLH